MLNEFISRIKSGGLARTNRYRVTISPPRTMTSFVDSNRLITLFCDSTELPGLGVNTTEHYIMGEAREYPYKKDYVNISLSFYVDTEFEVRGFFDNWMNSISDANNKISNYYVNYISPEMKIEVLPMDSELASYTVVLYEAYPKKISSIQLAAHSKDVARLGVSMNYKYYVTSRMTSVYQSTQNLQSLLSTNSQSTMLNTSLFQPQDQVNNELPRIV